MKIRICTIALLSVWMSMAQESRSLRGEIRSDNPVDMSWLAVKLDTLGSRGHGEVAAVTPGGDFEFRGMPEGIYTLRVVDSNGNEITSQQIMIAATNPPVSVKLPGAVVARPTGETTSVARLRHAPTRRAWQAAIKAQKFSESGEYERSAVEWKKAVDADPEFSEAHGNLGAQYIRLHRLAEAVEEFRRAIELDSATARHQSNLAVALGQLNQFDEAEKWARHAVELEGSNALGHFVLGCVLTWRNGSMREAIEQLQISSRQIPRAHQILSRIYNSMGKQALAVAELKEYQDASTSSTEHHAGTRNSLLH
jgi:tetratricopeptide (TPR) repeat protein